jgi:HEAT repeat protein
MGLVKRRSGADAGAERAARPRGMEECLGELAAPDADRRRAAARELAGFPGAAAPLCRHLGAEPDATVREAALTSLILINSDEVAGGLVPYFSSEDAALRNGAVEALQQMPEVAGPYVRSLLHDADSDVRIFAVDVLQALCHKEAPRWLCEALEAETHINVCATAVDRLAEIGTPDMIPALRAVARRFKDEPFMGFAVETAISRIEGGHRAAGE